MVNPGVTWFKPRLILRYQVVSNEKRKHVVVQQPFKNFPTYWKKWNWSIVLYWLLVVFLWIGTTMGFFQFWEKIPCSKQALKISPKGLLIESPQIFKMRMLIMLWSWALLGSKLLIILIIPLTENVMFDKDLSVKSSKSVGSTLLFRTNEHWSEKKEFNNSAFSLKSIINLFSWKIGGIQGTFLSVKKHFKIEQ